MTTTLDVAFASCVCSCTLRVYWHSQQDGTTTSCLLISRAPSASWSQPIWRAIPRSGTSSVGLLICPCQQALYWSSFRWRTPSWSPSAPCAVVFRGCPTQQRPLPLYCEHRLIVPSSTILYGGPRVVQNVALHPVGAGQSASCRCLRIAVLGFVPNSLAPRNSLCRNATPRRRHPRRAEAATSGA